MVVYEFMLILKPFLPEDVRNKLQKSITDQVVALGGKVDNEDIWGKRHLAYNIKGHEEGYYILYDITIPADHLEKFQQELNLMTDVLRYMIVRKGE